MTRTPHATRPTDDDPPRCSRGQHALYWRAVVHRISRYEHVPCRVVRIDDDGWVAYEVDGERRTGWNHDPAGLRAERPRDRRNAHLLGEDLLTVGSHAYLLLDGPSPCAYADPADEPDDEDDDDLWAD